jgi:hypothetical protein
MAITEPLLNEGSGFARQGTTVRVGPGSKPGGRDRVRKIVPPTPKVRVGAHSRKGFPVQAHKRGFPVRKGLRTEGAHPVPSGRKSAVPENESTVSRFTTSSVNAPLGYQGLFRGD